MVEVPAGFLFWNGRLNQWLKISFSHHEPEIDHSGSDLFRDGHSPMPASDFAGVDTTETNKAAYYDEDVSYTWGGALGAQYDFAGLRGIPFFLSHGNDPLFSSNFQVSTSSE